MQRWFFLDDRANDGPASIIKPPEPSSETDSSLDYVTWTFNVVVNQDLMPNEVVGLTGDWDSLGKWKVQDSILMSFKVGNQWTTTVELPRDRPIPYRYFICAVNTATGHYLVRNWETHIKTRRVPELDERAETMDIYGFVKGYSKVDRGWLTTEKILQLKFFNSPFIWKQKLKNRLFYIKVTPMPLRIQSEVCPAQQNSTDDSSLSNDTRENTNESPSLVFVEVASLKYDASCIKAQDQFGIGCGPDDLIIFHITVADFDNIAYLIDLFTYSSKATPQEPPFHLGYHYILPNTLKRSEGKLELPITCANRHRPLGTMECGYLIVKPFESCLFNMRVSYQRYWNKKWTGLDVGHRGSGTSFKAKDSVIRENTIASLKKAAAHGADMVEFDVQLSKDLVPVIYHDFNVYVSLKSKSTINVNDFLQLPMSELTLEQLKNFKVYHVVEGRSREPRLFDNEDCHEHQPFPELADVLEALDPHVGFNIEIKWSQELVDGSTESENAIDRNLYIDCILDVVIRKAGSRRIVFSCFDPDMCTMLRFKQNIYPVMFLTLGQTCKYVKYSDPRCNTIELAVCNARAMELLGIVAHTEDLLRDPTQVNLATNLGLIVFCWGEDNNNKDVILMLKKMGLHAIIYDKMDVLTPKATRESVFLVQARENQKELIQLQCLEMGKTWFPVQPSPCIIEDYDKILELQKERAKLAMSTATSITSLVETPESKTLPGGE